MRYREKEKCYQSRVLLQFWYHSRASSFFFFSFSYHFYISSFLVPSIQHTVTHFYYFALVFFQHNTFRFCHLASICFCSSQNTLIHLHNIIISQKTKTQRKKSVLCRNQEPKNIHCPLAVPFPFLRFPVFTFFIFFIFIFLFY